MSACSLGLLKFGVFYKKENKDLSPYIFERNAFRDNYVLSIHLLRRKTIIVCKDNDFLR